jgi:hypothetical protein
VAAQEVVEAQIMLVDRVLLLSVTHLHLNVALVARLLPIQTLA